MSVHDLFDLTGRVAVVTGGSRGIGRAIATGFAEAGADVVIASRKEQNCIDVAGRISAATGRKAVPLACNVSRWNECERLCDAVYSEFGRCDVLVNNAGSSPQYPSVGEITEEYYDKVHGLNLKGPFRLSAAVGTLMADGDGGNIINVSTIGALRPGSRELVYAVAKAGLNALTVGLAEAFGPKVRVNAILPGSVDTDIGAAWSDELKAKNARNPMHRMGRVDDFVGTALWLASPASSWVTGELVRVDGGAYRQTS